MTGPFDNCVTCGASFRECERCGGPVPLPCDQCGEPGEYPVPAGGWWCAKCLIKALAPLNWSPEVQS